MATTTGSTMTTLSRESASDSSSRDRRSLAGYVQDPQSSTPQDAGLFEDPHSTGPSAGLGWEISGPNAGRAGLSGHETRGLTRALVRALLETRALARAFEAARRGPFGQYNESSDSDDDRRSMGRIPLPQWYLVTVANLTLDVDRYRRYVLRPRVALRLGPQVFLRC